MATARCPQFKTSVLLSQKKDVKTLMTSAQRLHVCVCVCCRLLCQCWSRTIKRERWLCRPPSLSPSKCWTRPWTSASSQQRKVRVWQDGDGINVLACRYGWKIEAVWQRADLCIMNDHDTIYRPTIHLSSQLNAAAHVINYSNTAVKAVIQKQTPLNNKT